MPFDRSPSFARLRPWARMQMRKKNRKMMAKLEVVGWAKLVGRGGSWRWQQSGSLLAPPGLWSRGSVQVRNLQSWMVSWENSLMLASCTASGQIPRWQHCKKDNNLCSIFLTWCHKTLKGPQSTRFFTQMKLFVCLLLDRRTLGFFPSSGLGKLINQA